MNPTHLIITNRSGSVADGWIHIVPMGELPNRAAGLVQVLDETALNSILAGIESDKARLGNKWPGIYAGREHFIYNDEQDSAALAWFKDFEKRPDGIWAKADGLTPKGRDVVANAEYKFTSFVADRKDTKKLDGNKVRILKIDTVGFTNQANGKELLTPMMNRNPNFPGSSGQSGSDPADNQPHKTKMKTIATKLGLSAEASEDAILAEVTKVLNRATDAEGKLTPLQTRVTTLETENKTLLGDQIAAELETHGVKDEPIRNRLAPILAGMAKREDRLSFLKDVVKTELTPAGSGKVLNRRDAKDPSQRSDAATDGLDEQALAKKQQAEVETYRLQNRCTYATAHDQVRRMKPELFGLSKN